MLEIALTVLLRGKKGTRNILANSRMRKKALPNAPMIARHVV